jgi:hypothetical protein
MCLLVFVGQPRSRTLFAATSFLGIGIYSYIASTIMMPLYLVITLAVIWATVERPFRWWLIAAPALRGPSPADLVRVPPGVIVQTLTRYGLNRGVAAPWPVGAPMGVVLATIWRTARLSGRVSQYWSFFDPAYLFLTGGYANVVNSTRHVGVFPMPFIALIPIGLATSSRGGTPPSTRSCSSHSRRRRWRPALRSRSRTPLIESSSSCRSAC